MPRAATTASRRAKRDAQQPVPQKLARTAASVRAAAMANASASGGAESVSAPPIVKMKPEPTRTPIPAAAATKAKATVSSSPQRAPWRHPDELAYIRTAGKTWDDMAIARFLAGNAFGVPARNTNTLDPWVRVECADGSEVAVPRGYRFALLWVAKYLWTSVKLVLTAEDAIRQREWDGTKFEILHIARLCAALLGKARDAAAGGAQMERAWRCPQFDRALHRYWHEWLLMGDAFVRDFFREFGEEEYKTDVLKFPWSRWVLKSHKGFALTKEESADGISAAEFTRGFVVDEEKGTYEWKSDPDTPPAASSGDVDIAEAEVKAKPKATAVSASDVSKTTFSQEMVQTPATEQTPATAQKLIPVDDQVQMTVAAHASPSRVSFLVRPHGAFRPPPQVQPQPQPEGKATSQAAATDLAMAFDSADDSSREGSHKSGGDDQMQVDTPDPEGARAHEETIRGAGVVSTTMGSLQPGSSMLHGLSEEAAPGSKPQTEEEEEEDEDEDEEEEESEEEEDQEMAALPPNPIGEIATDELDLDDEEDLELLYPDHQEEIGGEGGTPAGDSPPAARPNTSPLASANNSPSRSVSPVPPLSSARFPPTTMTSGTAPDGAASNSTSTQQQLTVYSHPGQAAPPPDATDTDPGIVARFLHSCGVLGEDMRALRDEVAQLRAERDRVVLQLEARVRRLEEEDEMARAPVLVYSPSENQNLANASQRRRHAYDAAGGAAAARRWSHPLGHLLVSPDSDSEMDVDVNDGASAAGAGVGLSPVGDRTVTITKYSKGSGGGEREPLPPRSRKFNTQRVLMP